MHMQLCDNARITPLHKSRRDFSNKIFGHGAVTLGTAYIIATYTISMHACIYLTLNHISINQTINRFIVSTKGELATIDTLTELPSWGIVPGLKFDSAI